MMDVGRFVSDCRRTTHGKEFWQLALVAVLCGAGVAGAQTPPSGSGSYVTRAELQALANQPGQEGARERLRLGDFRVGDRILLKLDPSATLPQGLAESFNGVQTVQGGVVLRFPGIPDLQLAGVLRSELDSVVNTHLTGYLRNVRVTAEPQVQVLLSGPIGRPGYHFVSPDVLVTDVIMSAGGPAGNADLRRTTVRREGEEIISRDSLQSAILAGATLDRIDFRSGDELVVGERKRPLNWRTILSVTTALASLTFLVIRITR